MRYEIQKLNVSKYKYIYQYDDNGKIVEIYKQHNRYPIIWYLDDGSKREYMRCCNNVTFTIFEITDGIRKVSNDEIRELIQNGVIRGDWEYNQR